MSFEKLTINTDISVLDPEYVKAGTWNRVNMTNALTALRLSLTWTSVNLGVIAVNHVKEYVDHNITKLADHYTSLLRKLTKPLRTKHIK